MINIRKNLFETNSSSTHAICISQEPIDIESIPNPICIKTQNFGGEENIYTYFQDKINYIYTALIDIYDKFSARDIIYQLFYNNCQALNIPIVKIIYPEINKDNISENHVDHASCLLDLIDYFAANSNAFFQFIFSIDSFIHTGNDDNDDISIHVNYPHYEFQKKNN